MNREVSAVTDHMPDRERPKSDAKDWFVMIFLVVLAGSMWTYVFMHPSIEVFSVCVGSLGVFVTAFHWISVKDDKTPDEK